MAFLEYLYAACVTTIVSPSAFIETSLCTLYVVSPFIVVFVFIVATYCSYICNTFQEEIFLASNFLILLTLIYSI